MITIYYPLQTDIKVAMLLFVDRNAALGFIFHTFWQNVWAHMGG